MSKAAGGGVSEVEVHVMMWSITAEKKRGMGLLPHAPHPSLRDRLFALPAPAANGQVYAPPPQSLRPRVENPRCPSLPLSRLRVPFIASFAPYPSGSSTAPRRPGAFASLVRSAVL